MNELRKVLQGIFGIKHIMRINITKKLNSKESCFDYTITFSTRNTATKLHNE
jgi:hypothetical protein